MKVVGSCKRNAFWPASKLAADVVDFGFADLRTPPNMRPDENSIVKPDMALVCLS
jgi:hypothetical protein